MLIGFVGDVFVNRERPQEIFGAVRELLNVPSILFGNLEGAYSDDPRPVPGAVGAVCGRAHNLDAYAAIGFDVMSLANNHILDMGYEAMLGTRSRLRAQGIKTCGAGESLADARAPAIIEADGTSVAFLAYSSVFPVGYEARVNAPGIAPMRAYDSWRNPWPGLHMPGTTPLVASVPDPSDLAGLTDDLRRARERADLVVASFHWGDYINRYHLTDHERRTARHCIDHGADMVVGHHHHTLRGMEWYEGKPIFYGLGHFVFDVRLAWSEEEFRKALAGSDQSTSAYFEQTRSRGAVWPYPLHDDVRMTVLAWASVDRNGVASVGFVPCWIASDGLVHAVPLESREAKLVLAYLEECNRTQGLRTRLVTQDPTAIGGSVGVRVVPS